MLILFNLCQFKVKSIDLQCWTCSFNLDLRTVPTFVTAHTFCASQDTWVSYLVVPANTGIFLRSLKLCGESRTSQMLLVSRKKIGGSHAFFRDN